MGEKLVLLQWDGRWTPFPPGPLTAVTSGDIEALQGRMALKRTDAGPTWPEFRSCLRHFQLDLGIGDNN